MNSVASPPAEEGVSIKERLAALDRRIRHMRRDLDDTLELIERLRESCVNIKTNLTDAEREYAALLKDVDRL